MAAVLIGGATWWFVTPTHSQWNTAPGEQRTFTLEDGSRIVVNTRSRLEVRMGRSKREVRLLEGEAFFEVARDPSRPFLVVTSLGVARAVGTRFNVLLDGGREEVVTEEGKVLVQAPDGSTAGVLAIAGTKATLVQGQSQPSLAPADLTRIENWRAHRLEFDRVPLEVALKEFSRYTTVPIRAASEDVAQTYISAVLKTGDVQALATTLQGAFGLSLVAGQNEWLVVEPARHLETPAKEAAER
ncbi:MAG: FecR domain-containing protein [Gammaproteobacteria bacterium]